MPDTRLFPASSDSSPRATVVRFAHDAASPLMLVLTMTELISDSVNGDDKLRADLDEIGQAGRRLLEMIEELHERATGWTAG